MSKPMAGMVRVRVIKEFGRNWHMHRVGTILVPNDGTAKLWAQRGWVELVEDEVETAAVAPARKGKRRRKTRAKAT